jgi:hypothetical protein
VYRKGRVYQLVALAVALGVGGWLVAADPPARRVDKPAPAPQPYTLQQTWPKAVIADVDGQLADGTAYMPWLYVDNAVSVGTAPTADGTAERVLLRTGSAAPIELHRVPSDHFPQFLGFVAAGDHVYWAESTATADGSAETRLWQAPWKAPGAARSLTADMGAAVFYNSQFDLVVADGRVHWIAAAPTDTPITELRSVPITGGKVTMRTIDGPYQLSTWPWLQSAGGSNTPLVLLNTATDQKIGVLTSPGELVGCTPVWCRALVSSPSGGVTRFDLMRPDGSQRRRIAGGTASAATSDVALLDRFEIMTQGNASKQNLILYDIGTQKLVTVAADVGTVLARGGMLWWSTGQQEVAIWHALDLRTLA